MGYSSGCGRCTRNTQGTTKQFLVDKPRISRPYTFCLIRRSRRALISASLLISEGFGVLESRIMREAIESYSFMSYHGVPQLTFFI
jgi:hypothetical protein